MFINNNNNSLNPLTTTTTSRQQTSTGNNTTPINSSNNNNNSNPVISDFECPLCLNLLYEPVGFHCGHTFCKFCIERLLASNGSMNACPCCRAPFSDGNNSLITLKNIRPLLTLRNVLPMLFKEQYEMRRLEVEKERREYVQTQTIRKSFFIGNEHTVISRSDQNIHKWTMFVRMDSRENVSDFIHSVEYRLHPTFKPNVVVVDKAPFELTRFGWGYFTVKVKITFQSYLNKPAFATNHTLSFDGNGLMSQVEIDFLVKREQQSEIYIDIINSPTSEEDMSGEGMSSNNMFDDDEDVL
ncbi:predicted protein [Naegleria gruberi]|uniref:Predicted protein n=1 Tax=Naegleria gruberi TaxID=5762 RepID=D2V2W3_NAEGR|nr:uncharacterized protein NAEGRDRAFT_63139 [Naegleria gruberi]EFC49131.1 predicted protein [Naegleria gruberi]|eukprot:XP_002681875.1 predicted protein [Naegleria gruberi strain NEG-M]